MRRCKRNKSSGTTTAALDEDITTAALEALVPSELEQHLAMNRARLTMYEQIQSKIQANIEARRSQVAFKTVAAKNTSEDSFGQGGKKGGKKGRKWNGGGKNGKKGGKGKTRVTIPIPTRKLFVGAVG